MNAPKLAGPTVSSIFERLDVRPQDGAVVRDEVKKMVQDAKVGGGIFGGTKVNQATDALMDQFDPNKDGRVTREEMGTQLYGFLRQMVAADGPPPEPGKMAEKALEWFDQVDTDRNGKVSQGELKARIQDELEKQGQSFPGTKAEIAAKIGVFLLDEGKDGQAGRDEVESLARDVEAQGTPPAPPAPPPPSPAGEVSSGRA
jgi:Ca2+-binding EF-hand superfamily protein